MTQERNTGTAVGLIVGILLMMGGCGGEESSSSGGTGQVILKPPAGVFAAAKLPGQEATLDIVGTPLTGIPMTVKDDGSVSATVSAVPVGTWTFRITYSAESVSGPVVVAEASGVGTVTANTTIPVSLPWANTNFFSDLDAATNLEEVMAVPPTDPQNSEDWPVLPVAVSAGNLHSLALNRVDKTAWAWGSNSASQLGNNFNAQPRQPTPVVVGKNPPEPGTSLNDVVAVSAGETHSLALKKSDGTVWAWGSNFNGQLGTDIFPVGAGGTPIPRKVEGAGGSGFLTGVGAVSAGDRHSLAVTLLDGTVWAWGAGALLGNPAAQDKQPTPVPVMAGASGSGFLTGVVAVSAGETHSLALKDNGTAWAWGDNERGQLGNGLLADKPTPVQVVGAGGSGFLTGVIAVSAGGSHSLALKDDGTVWAWGDNERGQLGNTEAQPKQPTPVQVVGAGGSGFLTGVIAVSAGTFHSLALMGDGTVWAWGRGGSGQLGNDLLANQLTPVQVVGAGGSGFLTGVIAVSAGGSHSLALNRNSGAVWAWGSEDSGQLGNNIIGDFPQPTPVQVIGIR